MQNRTGNSIKNSISAITLNIVMMVIGFVSQAIFIKILGAEYLGLNGLFSNILTMLSIFDLGIGNAIVYKLYKPIAKKNIEKIKSLMKFYKKSYNIIAIIIFTVGLLIIPFLPFIVGEVNIDINITYIYMLCLLSTVSSYVITYKRSLIYANQNNYIINIVHMFIILLLNIFQIILLYVTKNYYLFLIIKIAMQLLENIIINIIANKLYPYLKEKNVKKMSKNDEKAIFVKIKALIFHKIGTILVQGTDNIIISSIFGVITVGLYSNYYMIINAINVLAANIISSAIASIGNLLVTESKEKVFNIFRKVRFLNFWLATYTSISLLLIIQPFIVIWVGKEYLLSVPVLIVLIFNYYQKLMRRTYGAFKDAGGIWVEDRYIPIIESMLNIVLSIIFAKLFGLAGVFIGTIASGLILWCYSYPKFVYKKLFNRSYKDYAKETLGYILLFIVISIITFIVSLCLKVNNNWLQVIVNTILCLILPNLLLYLLFRKNDNFMYYENLIKKIVKKH